MNNQENKTKSCYGSGSVTSAISFTPHSRFIIIFTDEEPEAHLFLHSTKVYSIDTANEKPIVSPEHAQMNRQAWSRPSGNFIWGRQTENQMTQLTNHGCIESLRKVDLPYVEHLPYVKVDLHIRPALCGAASELSP